MVPRRDIDFLVAGESVREAVERASGSLHTRLPLCEAEDGLDDAVGVINFKELLRLALEGVETDLSDLARPLARVSESMLVDQVLRELRSRRQHLALVVDEYGTTVGLITLEDILEEIVGEFEEEEDGEHDEDIRRDGDALLVQGSALLGEVEDELGIEIENAGEATIGGHLIELLGRVPEAGEVVELEGREVLILAVDEARIEALRIPLLSDTLED
jgi:magnesium and cobalt transporter